MKRAFKRSLIDGVMILIIATGYLVDGLLFKNLGWHLQGKWGMAPAA